MKSKHPTLPSKNTVEEWLFGKIAKPHKEIGNKPICPYLMKYKKQIHIQQTDDFMSTADNFAYLKDTLRIEAMVLYGKWMDYDKLNKIHNRINKKHKKLDVVCLMLHPDTEDPPLPIDNYNFTWPILILQKQSTLDKARENLRQKTDYYKYYNDDDK